MRQKVVLVTGANGEIGHGLIQYLAESTGANIVALDVVPLDKNLRPYCSTYIVGDILDKCCWDGWSLSMKSPPFITSHQSYRPKRNITPKRRTASTWKAP